MSRIPRKLAMAAVLGVLAYVLRGRLVDLLVRTTGTWVGSPTPPVAPVAPAASDAAPAEEPVAGA